MCKIVFAVKGILDGAQKQNFLGLLGASASFLAPIVNYLTFKIDGKAVVVI